MILNERASVSRLTPNNDDSDKEQYVVVDGLNNFGINVQPATPELTAVSEGAYGTMHKAFVAISGIMVGDQISISGTTKKYVVKGVDDWYYAPIPHLELVLFKGDA